MKRVLAILLCATLFMKSLRTNILLTNNTTIGNSYIMNADRGLDDKKPATSDKNVKTSRENPVSSYTTLQDYLRPSEVLRPSLTFLKERVKIEEIKKADNLDDADVQCKPELIFAFGIDEKVYEPQVASSIERKFCVRNTLTCCNVRHIEDTVANYKAGAKELKDRTEIVEELLSLFRGPAFQSLLIEMVNDEACNFIFDDKKLTKANLADSTYVSDKLDNIMSLLIDLEIYLKRQLWFYSNLVCTICSPQNHKYFSLNPQGSKMEVHVNTCIEIMEIKEFEVQLLEIFDQFISKIANYAICKTDDGSKAINPIDLVPVIEQKEKLERCYQNSFQIADPICRKFCEKSFDKFEFPTKFFSIASSTMKVIYEYMTENSINDYYQLVKKRDYNEEHLDDDIIFFNPQNEKYQNYKLSSLHWEHFSDHGVSIFSDHMSKKYTSSVSLILVIHLAVTGFWLLFK